MPMLTISDLRIRWRLSTMLKTSNKSVWSNAFWCVKLCVLWKFIQYTIHWDKTQMLNKFLRTKRALQKVPSFFFRELQLITVLILIRDSYMRWNTRFIFLKVCAGFSTFDSISVFLKFTFLFNNEQGLFDFKTSKFLSKLK